MHGLHKSREGIAADGDTAERAAFEAARLQLASLRGSSDEPAASTLRTACQVIAEALGVDGVSIWRLDKDRQRNGSHKELHKELILRYDARRDQVDAGEVLDAQEFPRHFAALLRRRVLAVSDARTDPVTAELAQRYLFPHDVVSMLDAQIIRDGEMFGTVCLEMIGRRRDWTQQEIDFAASVADIVALLMEQADRLRAQAKLERVMAQRLQGLKLEALGRMARSVAHDFNNLLMVMTGAIDGSSLSDCGACKQNAADLQGAIDLAQRLVRQLLDLGGRPAVAEGPVDCAQIAREALPILRGAVGNRARLELNLETNDTLARISRSEIEQVLLNLVVNAAEAVSQDGRILVTLRRTRQEDGFETDRLILEVRDNGVGMDAQTREHLFEPYFTTKPRGNGLGLPIVYGIVKGHGGDLQVLSEPGAGTTFRVALSPDQEPVPEPGSERPLSH